MGLQASQEASQVYRSVYRLASQQRPDRGWKRGCQGSCVFGLYQGHRLEVSSGLPCNASVTGQLMQEYVCVTDLSRRHGVKSYPSTPSVENSVALTGVGSTMSLFPHLETLWRSPVSGLRTIFPATASDH